MGRGAVIAEVARAYAGAGAHSQPDRYLQVVRRPADTLPPSYFLSVSSCGLWALGIIRLAEVKDSILSAPYSYGPPRYGAIGDLLAIAYRKNAFIPAKLGLTPKEGSIPWIKTPGQNDDHVLVITRVLGLRTFETSEGGQGAGGTSSGTFTRTWVERNGKLYQGDREVQGWIDGDALANESREVNVSVNVRDCSDPSAPCSSGSCPAPLRSPAPSASEDIGYTWQAWRDLRQAWPGVTWEAGQIVLAISRGESYFGHAPTFEGSHNQGAVQAVGDVPSFPHKDSSPTKTGPRQYIGRFRCYKNGADGFRGLLAVLLRGNVLSALQSTDVDAVAREMYKQKYFEGTSLDPEVNIKNYATMIRRNLVDVRNALSKPEAPDPAPRPPVVCIPPTSPSDWIGRGVAAAAVLAALGGWVYARKHARNRHR
jgi:hypothetical protein